MVLDNEDVIDLERLDHQLEKHNFMPLIMLDGFFAGIASLDEELLPDQWLEHISLKSTSEQIVVPPSDLLQTLNDYYVSVIHDLTHGTFEPLLDDEQSQLAAKSWVNGFMAALSLEGFEWLKEAPEDLYAMINILTCFRLPEDEAYKQVKLLFDESPTEEQITEMFGQIPDGLKIVAGALYEFKFGEPESHEHHHHHGCACPSHEAPKAQRNDPCPCGSGKKFKKCCLH